MSSTRNLSSHEHQLIGDIIGDSFSDDPVNRWTFGDSGDLPYFYAHAAKHLYLKRGYGHVMSDGKGGSLWLPPGEKKHIPLWRIIGVALSMVRHGGLGSLIRGLKVDSALAQAKPTQPHYYLFSIGARQGCLGQGIGKKLMLEGLAQADAAGMPAYLESSKEVNVPFYRRFGFEVIEKIVPAEGCPPLWLMWREANVDKNKANKTG